MERASPAYESYAKNVGAFRESYEVFKELIVRLNEELDRLKQSLLDGKHLEEGKWEKMLDLNGKCERESIRKIEWVCVMLVTYVETFLEDAFAYYARLDDTLMGNGGPSADFSLISEVESLEELRDEMRQRWAKAHWTDGGKQDEVRPGRKPRGSHGG